jgi:hypothetical protein
MTPPYWGGVPCGDDVRSGWNENVVKSFLEITALRFFGKPRE